LRDFLCKVWRADNPTSGGVNEVDMATHDLGERCLIALLGVGVKQIMITQGHLISVIAAMR